MNVRCESIEAYRDLCEKLRYFEFDGKECRALGFNENLIKKKQDPNESDQIFVKGVPLKMSQKELHDIFKIYGPIASLKISRNSDHSSKGFAYISFEQTESAEKAISKGAHMKPNQLLALRYVKKSGKQSTNNNLYVKFIPDSWS